MARFEVTRALVFLVLVHCNGANVPREGGSSWPVKFDCTQGSATCPPGMCPTTPLGSGGCEKLPGLFGHAPMDVDAGRPEGCAVSLSYENPYYPGSPQTCTCSKGIVDGGLEWICPL